MTANWLMHARCCGLQSASVHLFAEGIFQACGRIGLGSPGRSATSAARSAPSFDAGCGAVVGADWKWSRTVSRSATVAKAVRTVGGRRMVAPSPRSPLMLEVIDALMKVSGPG